MNLRDIDFINTYWSSESDLVNDFYIPCLSNSIKYSRAVGYFNSSILEYISVGIFQFIQNGGSIRIVCSVNLSELDENLIQQGYDERIQKILESEIESTINTNNTYEFKNLCWLVKNNKMDFKVCMRRVSGKFNNYTLFHEKFGVFEDVKGNQVSFIGSVNETFNGWLSNEESFEVSYSWEPILKERVDTKTDRFEKLWKGVANSVVTLDFPNACREKLINNAPNKPIEVFYPNKKKSRFIPRKCQAAAKEAFINSNYCCLFQMATGSGKTKAAVYSLSDINEWKVLLIAVPSLELVEQWESDVKLFFPETYIIKCGGIYARWKEQVLSLIQARIPERVVIITTYDSAISGFAMEKWKCIKEDDLAMICDEVHNIGAPSTSRIMELKPKYRIGLSATPHRNFDEEGTERIIEYYNNNSYEFTIKEAIAEGYLVNYDYFVYPCILSDIDWALYVNITKKINKLRIFANGSENEDKNKKSNDKLNSLYRDRADIIKTLHEKNAYISRILKEVSSNSRVLIYGDSLKQLNEFEVEIDKLGKQYFVYTGEKDTKIVRPKMLEEFKYGIRKILLAIGCLDEGIDIPVCDVAIFVSSSTSQRQFIQRRGRVLRSNPTKHRAYVYDFIVVPNISSLTPKDEMDIAQALIESQYRRINQIAEDAINGGLVRAKLDKYLESFQLNPYQF